MRVHVSPSWTPPSHLPPHPIPQGHPSALTLGALSPASNLDWRSVSHMVIYMCQCHSLKSPTHSQSPSPTESKSLLFISVSQKMPSSLRGFSFWKDLYFHYHSVLNNFWWMNYLKVYWLISRHWRIFFSFLLIDFWLDFTVISECTQYNFHL